MALIRCPECGKEISDKSEKCISCGYPLRGAFMCKINGREYDVSFLLDDSYSVLYKVRDLIQISGSDIAHVRPIVEKISKTREIPSFLNLPRIEELRKPKCPRCGSTNIQVMRKWSTFGRYALDEVDRVCVNCKYKF